MIRQCIKNIIFDTLNYDIFRFEDFIINETTTYNEDRLLVRKDDFYFQIAFSKDTCVLRYSPGKVLMEENLTMSIDDFENMVAKVLRSWMNRLKRDLLNPLQERFIIHTLQEFQEKLDEKLAEIEDNVFFTKEENEQLNERLDSLQQMIIDMYSEREEMKSEVYKMKQEIEFLKQTIGTMNKKNWLKNAITKMYAWSQQPENKKLIEAGASAVKKISEIDFSSLNG